MSSNVGVNPWLTKTLLSSVFIISSAPVGGIVAPFWPRENMSAGALSVNVIAAPQFVVLAVVLSQTYSGLTVVLAKPKSVAVFMPSVLVNALGLGPVTTSSLETA